MSATQARPAVQARATARVVCTVSPMVTLKKVATGFGVGIASLALSASAFAATVKLGADSGESGRHPERAANWAARPAKHPDCQRSTASRLGVGSELLDGLLTTAPSHPLSPRCFQVPWSSTPPP